MWKDFQLLLIVLLMGACGGQSTMDTILSGGSENFQTVVANAEDFELQIIYVQIDRDARNRPEFTTYSFGVDPDKYFYPASTVKMPVALLALEKVNILGLAELTSSTRMQIDSARYPQSRVLGDSTSASGEASVGHYSRKIFLVSDNDAYNRLYEFVGQGAINEGLISKGIYSSRIIHRLSDFRFGPEENKITNPVSFYHADTLVYQQPEVTSEYTQYRPKKNEFKGLGYIDANGDSQIGPFDFSKKNFVPLPDQVAILKRIIFPESFAVDQVFNLTEEDRREVLKSMSEWPRESDYPAYDPESYRDSYVKFFIYGDNEEELSGDIRIFNKVGVAYGYLTDIAYITDFVNNIEFALAATIHVNKNKIYNDGQYEYDEVGIPFLAELGRKVHGYEMGRERKHVPDLTGFQLIK